MLTDMRPAANFASCDMPMIVKIMRSIVRFSQDEKNRLDSNETISYKTLNT